MNLVSIIQQHQKELGELDKEILSYILENQQEVEKMSIIELGEKVHTSKSTILRLTKKIGFSGFSEFKFFLKQGSANDHLVKEEMDIITPLETDILRTLDYLKSLDFSNLLRKLEEAETIYCFGTGYSQRKVVEEFSKMMICVEKRVLVLPNKTEFDMSMPMIKQSDIVLFVSLSGETEEVKENLTILNMRSIPTVAITAFGDNFFSKTADFSMFYYTTPIIVGKKSYVASSLIGLSTLMDFLFRKYGEYNRNVK